MKTSLTPKRRIQLSLLDSMLDKNTLAMGAVACSPLEDQGYFPELQQAMTYLKEMETGLKSRRTRAGQSSLPCP